MNPSEYKETKEMLETTKEMVDTQKELTVNSIISKGYDPDKIRTLCAILLDKVNKSFTPDESTDQPEKSVEEGETKKDLVSEKTDVKLTQNDEEIKRAKKNMVISLIKSKLISEFDDVRAGILLPSNKDNEAEDRAAEIEEIADAFADMLDYLDTEHEYDLVKAYHESEANKMVEYMNSEEFYNKRLEENEDNKEQLAKLEAVTGKDRNFKLIRELKQKIAVTDGRFDFSFMRLNSKITPKNTAEVFFDSEKSSYVMKRYYDKCHQMHLNPDVFRYFMNIEEKNLDEKYHPFNNLFLFHCIRYMAYLDTTYDELQFRTIVGTLTKLVYDTFPNDETKETTLQMIRDYLDQFINAGLTDQFISDNESYPKHPERIKKDAERERSARDYYCGILEKSMKEKFDEAVAKKVEEMPIADLIQYTKEMSDKALAEETSEIADQFGDLSTSDQTDTTTTEDSSEE